MFFKQACFIRKNSESIRKHLDELGYDEYWCWRDYPIIVCWWINYKAICWDMLNESVSMYTAIEEDDIDDYTKHRAIDCGSNLRLFYAIAALTDETDINQWFCNGDEWILSKEDKFSQSGFHKADVEELIEHFKVD